MTEKATNSEKSATRIQDLDFAKMSLDELKRLDYQKIVVLSREGLEELEVNLIAAKNELRLVLDKESQEAKRRNKIRTLLNGGENKVVIKETTAIVREKIEFLVDLANYVLGILNKKEPLERKDITPESIIAILNSDAIVGDDVLERMREILQSNEFGTSYELAMGKIEERLAQNQEKEDIAAEEDFSLAETEILSSKVEEIVEGSEEKFLLEEDPEEEKEKVNLDDPKSLNHPEFIDIGLLSKQEKKDLLMKLRRRSDSPYHINDAMSEFGKNLVRGRMEKDAVDPKDHIWTQEHQKLLMKLIDDVEGKGEKEYIPLKDRR